MVDQTVTMIENIQDNLQEPPTSSALVQHPKVVIKREGQSIDVEKNSCDDTEGSIENDANRAFIEDEDKEESTPGNV